VRACALLLVVLLVSSACADDALTVAVASNFSRTADELAVEFTAASGIDVRYSRGSTGKLYAQILQGAPYQVFLAADAERPALLEESGHAVPGSRFTYATGALVLWSPGIADCYDTLVRGSYNHVAIANPDTAPYGRAARQFLAAEGLWETASQRAVYGESVGQALQFVSTGNAQLGLVARAQLVGIARANIGCQWPVSAASHEPIEQQAVVLAGDDQRARRFAEYLRTDKARAIIARHGYELAP